MTPFRRTTGVVGTGANCCVLKGSAITCIVSVLPHVKRTVVKNVDDFTIGVFMLIFMLCFVLVKNGGVRRCIGSLLPFGSSGARGIVRRVGVVIHSGTVNVPLLTIVRKKMTVVNC